MPMAHDAPAVHLPGNPAWAAGSASASFLGLSAAVGLEPFGTRDLADYGDFLNDADKAEIMDDVRSHGFLGLSGNGQVDLLGINMKGFGLEVGARAEAQANLPPELVELLLYGNVGQSGDREHFDFSDLEAGGGGAVRVGGSYARGIPTLPVVAGLRVNRHFGMASIHLEDDGSWVDRSVDGGGRIETIQTSAEGWSRWSMDIGALGRLRGLFVEGGIESILLTSPSGSLADLEVRTHSTDLDGDDESETVRTGDELTDDELDRAIARVRVPAPGRRVYAAAHTARGALAAGIRLSAGEANALGNNAQLQGSAEIGLWHLGIRPHLLIGSDTSGAGMGLGAALGPAHLVVTGHRLSGTVSGMGYGFQASVGL